ncbi:GAF domain-containing protein [Gandjariella thermophila]|uniref:Rv3651-like N-terminal domain-containing protein n=1 Tax=Gandjariella thermophila TaxID=1931992 RepID=A0A4D4JCD9_9PSEU|nr:GAF domain-containing protein [Gandjariella thermophila]GDY33032.1 hypothetical protein GTS_46650 [Gandjariella thermophila]
MADKEWLVVDTLSNSPTVVAAGSRARKWRPLGNVFRGSQLTMVEKLVGVVVDNLKDSQSLVDLTHGTKLAYARPILGPGRQVHAVMVWLGTKDENPPAPPKAIGWTWDLADPGRPRTVPHPGTAEFYGFPGDFDPTVTDLLSTLADISEIAQVLHVLADAQEGRAGTGEWLMRRPNGLPAKIRYAFRGARSDGRLQLHGISQEISDYVVDRGDFIAADVLRNVVGKRHPAFVHVDSGHVQSWLSGPPESLPDAVVRGFAPAPTRERIALPGLPKTTVLSVFS